MQFETKYFLERITKDKLITQRDKAILHNQNLKQLLSEKDSHIYEVVQGMNIPILEFVKEIQALDMVHNIATVVVQHTQQTPVQVRESSVLELVSFVTLAIMRSIIYYQSRFITCHNPYMI